MGYESSGSGTFRYRTDIEIDKEQATNEILNTEYFESDGDMDNEDELFLSFCNMRMYWKDAIKALETVAEYCDGEFEIYGGDSADHWKLIFKEGKILRSQPIISWTVPEEYKLQF